MTSYQRCFDIVPGFGFGFVAYLGFLLRSVLLLCKINEREGSGVGVARRFGQRAPR